MGVCEHAQGPTTLAKDPMGVEPRDSRRGSRAGHMSVTTSGACALEAGACGQRTPCLHPTWLWSQGNVAQRAGLTPGTGAALAG